MQSTRIVLMVLLGLALLVRIGWAWRQPSDPQSLARLGDQQGYLELAQNLLNGNGLRYFEERFNEDVRAMRLPGYPAFVALCGASPRATRIAQAFIDTSTVLAVYLLARRWLNASRSLFASAIIAANPFSVYFTGLLLTETLFTAMLAWGMVLLAHRRDYVWGGIVLALSILVRPSAMLLPLALGIAAVFANRHRDAAYHRRWPLPVGATMLLLTFAVLVPWAYRNHVVLGRWLWTTSNDGLTAYDGFNPDATGASDQSFVHVMPFTRYPTMNELQRSDYLSQLARRYIREHPRRAAQLALIKVARTWSPIPLSSEYGSNRLYVAVGLFFGVPFYLLTLAGLIWGKLPVSAKVFLALPAVYFTIVHALSVGSLRYRIPAEAPMAVIAAAATFARDPFAREGTRNE